MASAASVVNEGRAPSFIGRPPRPPPSAAAVTTRVTWSTSTTLPTRDGTMTSCSMPSSNRKAASTGGTVKASTASVTSSLMRSSSKRTSRTAGERTTTSETRADASSPGVRVNRPSVDPSVGRSSTGPETSCLARSSAASTSSSVIWGTKSVRGRSTVALSGEESDATMSGSATTVSTLVPAAGYSATGTSSTTRIAPS